jgi:rod shape-determining protein MreB
MLIGERTAEEIKINIGSAFPRKEEAYMEVTGRNLISGLPKTITISSNETIEAMQEPLNRIMETIHGVLERTPPELTADIAENGICMTGGGSLLYGLDRLLTERTKIPCYVAEDAISCVAIGTGKALESIDAYSERAVYDYRRGDYYNSNL